jgi:Ca2+-transporting ATPase
MMSIAKEMDCRMHNGLTWLQHAAVMANEGVLEEKDGDWSATGDSVDCSLLIMAKKAGFHTEEIGKDYIVCGVIPYESRRKCSAVIVEKEGKWLAFVKGAVETLLAMSTQQMGSQGPEALATDTILAQQKALSAEQYRVLAFAYGEVVAKEQYGIEDLQALIFLGMVGMTDPLRPEAKDAIAACHEAGIHTIMVTGDHPDTAGAIAKELHLTHGVQTVVTGPDLRRAQRDDEQALDALTQTATVYARVEPAQKLDIVDSLIRGGHFVAVTGDGVNDAPALRHAHVGVAMGLKGTDVARESADIILTDDHFASIVAGVEEGRIAYNNIRKIVFFLIATSVAEVAIFLAAIALVMPMPLIATQLLWLNFATSIIQDVALAFEPAEGNELKNPPRAPQESLFDRLMLIRIAIVSGCMALISFGQFYWMIEIGGYDEAQARNLVLLQFVLFENVIVLNCRSETQSFFSGQFFSNPLLLYGTIAAQLIHIAALHMPFLQDALHIQPVSWQEWLILLGFAGVLMAVMEWEKALRRYLYRKNAR